LCHDVCRRLQRSGEFYGGSRVGDRLRFRPCAQRRRRRHAYSVLPRSRPPFNGGSPQTRETTSGILCDRVPLRRVVSDAWGGRRGSETTCMGAGFGWETTARRSREAAVVLVLQYRALERNCRKDPTVGLDLAWLWSRDNKHHVDMVTLTLRTYDHTTGTAIF
jgi:hypothetical protein